MNETIVALSSGPPPAAIGVIRVSGPAALTAATAIAGRLPEPRRAGLRPLRDGPVLLDRALVLVFPAPDSATGEDLVELHVHGGPAVVRAVETALLGLPGVRQAEAGEFTRRALRNGRLDLAQVEALGDLLSAQTAAQHRAAVLGLDGSLRRSIDRFVQQVLRIAADIEVALDFADEEDGAGFDPDAFRARISALEAEMREALARPVVENLHRGFRVVLAGRPNRGKSTLLNVLTGRDAAIVSPVAGTTRDRIEVQVAHGGVAFVLTDTAGLVEHSDDPVEAIGVARSHEALAAADVILWLEDDLAAPPGDVIRVASQADLPGRTAPSDAVSVSALTGEGIERLWAVIHARVANRLPPDDGTALNRRQHAEMGVAATSLAAAAQEDDLLLCAERLREGRRALDRITGAAGTEAMLDRLFGSFCIGK